MLYWLFKRLIDLLFVIVLLPVLLVFYVCLAILIKLDSPGPVILKQERIGKNMRPFMMYKFRSMYTNTDIDGMPPTGAGDPRVTKIGAFLRKSSIDESPQLINVFLGNMSLVGPRPEIKALLPHYESADLKRFQALPGLTGLWQISGRKDKQSISEKAKIDIDYINKASLWLDILILIKTPLAVFKARGAY